MNCNVCGQDYLRCNCVSQQPYCEQCSENDNCTAVIDADCVIYHEDNIEPTKLLNLNLPNGTNATVIFEEIDKKLGSFQAIETPITIIPTSSILATATGTKGHTLTIQSKISSQAGNEISVNSDGLYTFYSGKIRVSSTGSLDYLSNKLIGAANTYVQISVQEDSDVLEIVPTVNLNALKEDLEVRALAIQDTNSVNLSLSQSTTTDTISADVKISATAGNIITINSDGIFAPSASTYTFNNGLNESSGTVHLGGALVENTEINDVDFNLRIDNNALLLGNLSSLSFTQPTGYTNGQNIRYYLFHKTNIRQAAAGATREYNALVLDNTSLASVSSAQHIGSISNTYLHFADNAAFTTSTQTGAFGTFLSLSSINSATITSTPSIAANMASVYFESPTVFGETAGTPGTIDNVSIYKTVPPSFQAGMNAGNTPTVTNLYSVYIDDLASGSAQSKFTNKFAIYQVGTTDISRFFGPVQNASSVTQFTSDSRVKENIIPFTRGLTEIDLINPRRFNYTYNKNSQVTGIIAQELEQIIPEAVQQGSFKTPEGEEFADFRMVDQTILFYTMLNAIKELSAKVKALENI